MTPYESGDPRLEEYLKSFRPLAPAALPRRTKTWTAPVLQCLVAAAVIVAILFFARPGSSPVAAEPVPMTLGKSNALLVSGRPWNEILNETGFSIRPAVQARPSGVSAFELLSREDLEK
jgi:hypothetical protein